MRVGRIPYVNCAPVYGAIDRGVIALAGELVPGVPTALNAAMAAGTLDVSVWQELREDSLDAVEDTDPLPLPAAQAPMPPLPTAGLGPQQPEELSRV